MPDVAVAHDSYTSDGGAERVATDIARLFDAPIYATRVDEEFCPQDIDAHEMWDSWTSDFWHERKWWLPRTAYWMGRHLYRHQRATYAPKLTNYDIIIQTKGPVYPYVPQPEQTVIRYCHSPPRRHYDQFHNTGGSFLSRLWSLSQRLLDQPHADYPDAWVANSDVVAKRIEKYYNEHASVVYPGVNVRNLPTKETQDYLFYISRLADNKRIGLLKKVAEATQQRVVVAGNGPKSDLVRNTDAIEWLGYISDAEKWDRLAEAKATLFFAKDEDFGIVPIESFAAGTPVIGVNEGFTKYQIVHHGNGYVCEPDVSTITSYINTLYNNGVEWHERKIKEYAQQFSQERFNQELESLVMRVHGQNQISTDIQVPRETEVATDD